MTRAKRPSKHVMYLFEAKLASSGLDLDDAKQLRMEPLEGGDVAKLHKAFKPLSAIKFNYFNHLGAPMSDWPACPPYYRLRYLEEAAGFAEVAKGKNPQRYMQEPATRPCAYYPQNANWAELALDTDEPLIITEGELKAAKATKEGFPTIGLGGVWSWRALKSGIEWLPSLEFPEWKRRNVYICFDSDINSNPSVGKALRELAKALEHRGAYVHLAVMPELPETKKVGIDDFFVLRGANAAQEFGNILTAAFPLGLTRAMFSLNDQYIYIKSPGIMVNLTTEAKSSPSAFKDHVEATERYQEGTLGPDGTVTYQPVSLPAAWLRWPLRYEADRLTYSPGKDSYFTDKKGTTNFNVWPGWACDPLPGDLAPFHQLVDHLFTGAEPGAKEWFLRWLAFPLQYPGTKLFSSAVVHGIRHGTGKSLIGYTMKRIYGKNWTEIDKKDIENSFNEWAESKQFVMGDDVTGSNKRDEADYLKKIITQSELRVNMKYVPTYVIPDCVNYYFTANHPDAFFLEDGDRRFFIHEVIVEPMPEEFYVEYDLWLDSGGGAHVFDYLLKLDLGDFNPAAPAFATSAKERMIANVRSDLGSWVRQLVSNSEHVLRVGDVEITKDLFTSKELLVLYDPMGRTGTTANGLGRELAKAGVRQVAQGKPLRLADGSQGRYYAVRNAAKWLTATPKELADHLEDGAVMVEKRVKY